MTNDLTPLFSGLVMGPTADRCRRFCDGSRVQGVCAVLVSACIFGNLQYRFPEIRQISSVMALLCGSLRSALNLAPSTGTKVILSIYCFQGADIRQITLMV